LAESITTSASFTREKNPEDFKASVNIRYGKLSDQLLDTYELADSTTPKTANFIKLRAFGNTDGTNIITYAELNIITAENSKESLPFKIP